MQSAYRVLEHVVGAAADNETVSKVPGVSSIASIMKAPSVRTGTDLKEAAIAIGSGVGGAVIGQHVWKKHNVLGALAGMAVGVSAERVIRGGESRRDTVARLATDAAAIGGALAYKKHPVVGYIVGALAGNLASEAVVGHMPYMRLLKR